MNSTWRSDDDMDSAFKNFDIFSHTCSSDASVNFDFMVFSDRMNNKCTLQGKFSGWCNNKSLRMHTGRIDNLQCRNGESTSFTSTRLCLSNGIMPLNDRENTFLLNWRWFIKTISINTSEYLFFEAHVIKLFSWLIPIWFEIFVVSFFFESCFFIIFFLCFLYLAIFEFFFVLISFGCFCFDLGLVLVFCFIHF